MKKMILMTLTLMTTVVFLQAQNGNRDYNFRDNNRYNYRYNDYDDRRFERNYNRGNYGYRYLPVDVRRDLNRLERRLADCKYKALRDGYISRNEARRINRIERQIDELLFDYRASSYRTRRGYRPNRICR